MITPTEVKGFQWCISEGGVALFPTDTVYGLACDPESESAVKRLYLIKGRQPDRPAAVMFFQLAAALATLSSIGERTIGALQRLLPGPVTVLLPNPEQHYPLACGSQPDVLGLRVPQLEGSLESLSAVTIPFLQSSANRSGAGDIRSLDQLDVAIREAVDTVLDAGELPGVASTVIDLTDYENGQWQVLREGALPTKQVVQLLR